MGFSFYGLIIAVLIYAPGLTGLFFPPENVPPDMPKAPLFCVCMEKIGQVCSFFIICFSRYYIAEGTPDIFLVLFVVFAAVNYALWLRYYENGSDIGLLYDKLFFIPVPIPVFFFLTLLCVSLWCENPWLTLTAVFYAVGEIPIYIQRSKYM